MTMALFLRTTVAKQQKTVTASIFSPRVMMRVYHCRTAEIPRIKLMVLLTTCTRYQPKSFYIVLSTGCETEQHYL